jgi:ferredoxin
MTYVVSDACVRCKFMDCVDVCPVECFHEGENMLVIDPEGCIDCGVCVPECPASAILSDSDASAGKWVEVNKAYSQKWPIITQKASVPEDADAFIGVEGKFETFFSSKAGTGN